MADFQTVFISAYGDISLTILNESELLLQPKCQTRTID